MPAAIHPGKREIIHFRENAATPGNRVIQIQRRPSDRARSDCRAEKLALGLLGTFHHTDRMKITVNLCTLMLAQVILARIQSALYEIPLNDIDDRHGPEVIEAIKAPRAAN